MIKHTNDRADRSVDFIFVLKHELPVHISLAIMNGTVRTGNKSELANVMTKYIYCPETIQLHDSSSFHIIDVLSKHLLVSLGKRYVAATFADLVDSDM